MRRDLVSELSPVHLNLFREALADHDIAPALSDRIIDRIKVIDPGLIIDPGFVRPIDPGPRPIDPPVRPEPAQPAAPSAEPPQLAFLAMLLGQIPVAVDGAVITADYHNQLRAVVIALVQLAQQQQATIRDIQSDMASISDNLQGLTGRVDTTHSNQLSALTQDVAALRAKVEAALAVAQKPPAGGPPKILTDDFKLDPAVLERLSTDLDKRTATVLVADAIEKARSEGKTVDTGEVESRGGDHLDRGLFRTLGRTRFIR